MKSYNVELTKQAQAYLSRLDKITKQRIVNSLYHLAADPSDNTLDIRPLAGNPGLFRLRVGKYRIIYSIEEEIKIISVSTILPRGEVYKRF